MLMHIATPLVSDSMKSGVKPLGHVETTSLLLAVATLGLQAKEVLPCIYGLLSTSMESLTPSHLANVLLALATMNEYPTNLMLRIEKKVEQ